MEESTEKYRSIIATALQLDSHFDKDYPCRITIGTNVAGTATEIIVSWIDDAPEGVVRSGRRRSYQTEIALKP
jgi:hypothetical protein